MKLLFRDGTGLVPITKRLEQSGFRWPTIADGVMRLSPGQLSTLLDKGNCARGRLTTTVSLFEITQPSMITTTSGGLDYLRRDGRQRNRGIEFNFFGEVTEGVRLLGGLTLLDGRLTKTEGGVNDGNKAVAAPDRQLSFGVEWDPPAPGLAVNGRVM